MKIIVTENPMELGKLAGKAAVLLTRINVEVEQEFIE